MYSNHKKASLLRHNRKVPHFVPLHVLLIIAITEFIWDTINSAASAYGMLQIEANTATNLIAILPRANFPFNQARILVTLMLVVERVLGTGLI